MLRVEELQLRHCYPQDAHLHPCPDIWFSF